MFGYLRVYENELKIKEYNLYKQAYCRLCRNIGYYSETARLFLSYDMTFFALLLDETVLASNVGEKYKMPKCHKLSGVCLKEKSDEVYNFAAAASIVLVYEKTLDKLRDGERFGRLQKALVLSAYKKVKSDYPLLCETVTNSMDVYNRLEEDKSDVFVLASAFGSVMRSIASKADFLHDRDINNIVMDIFFKIGEVVYMIDAVDDLENDRKNECYNPITYHKQSIDKVLEYVVGTLDEAVNSMYMLPYSDSIPILLNVVNYGIPNQLYQFKKGKDYV